MFTVYYILAPAFGAFAVIVSLIGLKNPQSFPGKFYGPMIAIGILFGISTVFFVWRGGEKEASTEEHKQSVEDVRKAVQTIGTGTANPLPAGVRLPF